LPQQAKLDPRPTDYQIEGFVAAGFAHFSLCKNQFRRHEAPVSTGQFRSIPGQQR
jgi:hypothetical protein